MCRWSGSEPFRSAWKSPPAKRRKRNRRVSGACLRNNSGVNKKIVQVVDVGRVMKKRLRKKRDKAVLQDAMIELSQDSAWRERLFAGRPDELFAIEACRERKIPAARFTVRRSVERPGLLVPFIFESVEFPEVFAVSYNTPGA